MSFNIFNDQIQERRTNDEQAFTEAFDALAGVLEKRLVQTGSPAQIKDAIGQVLQSLGCSPVAVPEQITDLNEQLLYSLRPHGIMRRRVELTGSWWKHASGSYLGSTRDGQVVALLPGRLSGYRYRHPDGQWATVTKQTAQTLNEDAFCFYRPLPARRLTLLDLAWHMARSISRADVVFVLAASLLASLVGLLMPMLNRQIYQSIIPSGLQSNILPMAGLMLGAAAGTTLFGVTRSAIMTRFMEKINLSVQSAAMMRVLTLPANFFRSYSAGELTSRLMGINTLSSALSNAVLTSGLTALFSLVYITQMLSYAPALVLPAMGVLLASLSLSILTTFMQLSISRQNMKLSAKLSGLVFALISGVQKIRLTGSEKRAFARWANLYAEKTRLDYAPPLFLRLTEPLSELVFLGGTLVMYFYAGLNKIATADYLAFNVAYGMVSGAVMSMTGMAMTAASIKPTLEMVQPIFETVPESSDQRSIVTSLSGSIELNGVQFGYQKDAPLILDHLNLRIRSGEYVAIVGKTGCGKSTLLRLLLGFEKPQTGAIYYDGRDLNSLDPHSLRRSIGVVMQNSKLFAGDIFSNIIVTSPDKTLDDAWEAARMAGLADDIKDMPMGMHTIISEGGGGLSGGQKQRLMIARAIVGRPRILYFDEATSALDNLTQKQVSDSIDQLKCTRVVIAHRLSTIRHADRIVLLAGGKITEEGSYDQLMAMKGQFYDMVERQTL
ncbi:MAG: NHLP bacteriocin export ABC transporter permease/ATPase subunit [Eubacteriales bacterium]|nr:NHLP bacteriocin export ABC transporter permease/ATPase subunit [Eubacteriales bacterium]